MNKAEPYTIPISSMSRLTLSPRLLTELKWAELGEGWSCWVLVWRRGVLLCAPESMPASDREGDRHPFQSVLDYWGALDEIEVDEVLELPSLEKMLVRWRVFKVGTVWAGSQLHLKLGKELLTHLGYPDARTVVALPAHGILSLADDTIAREALFRPLSEVIRAPSRWPSG